MKKLILHIGPGKCGSSSIQKFFHTHKSPCMENIKFIEVLPKTIWELNEETASSKSFADFFNKSIKNRDVLILSHEAFFSHPTAVNKICKIANDQHIETTIIGYSRQQSGFLVSSYSQWGFRKKERVDEVKNILTKNNIDPILFTGVEKQLISFIVNDFRVKDKSARCNWNQSYQKIETLEEVKNVTIKVGTLPTKNSELNLIEDFLLKANLTLKEELKGKTNVVENKKFDASFIEAINTAINYGFEINLPHIDNDLIFSISSQIKIFPKGDNAFLSKLKNSIDHYFQKDNREFSDRFQLDKSYFSSVDAPTKEEIIELIKEEEKNRLPSKPIIENYKQTLANITDLYMKSVKKGKKSFFDFKR